MIRACIVISLPTVLLLATGTNSIAASEPADHWAFRSVERRPLPNVEDMNWARNPVDRFVPAGLEQKGLTPSPPAGKRQLVRRAYLDLIGLPPSLDETDAFVNDTSADAYQKLIDRLLSKPQYGERWGRHWLDLVRYADRQSVV